MLPRRGASGRRRGIVVVVAMPTWTILLADPDPLQRQLVDMLLAQEAFQIVNAGNGRDTLEYLKEHTPHLAILALELPDVGGDVICRKLKAVKRLSNVPVILTTKPPGQGGLSTDLRQVARSVGADLFLQKPLGDKGLRDKVNQLLRRRQARSGDASRRGTTNTVIIEEAIHDLAGSGQDTSAMDSVTEALYRENEELREEVASLKRRLARLEAGLATHRDGTDVPPTFIPGSDPATPMAMPSADAEPANASGPETTPTAAGGAVSGEPGTAADAGTAARPAAATSQPVTLPAEDPAPAAHAADEDADDTVDALKHRITDLERRNRALIGALEEAEAREEAPRGLFGRRRR
jgi:DNA-binding response OmpR family regulator